jgi:hypothetical protein
MTPRFIPDLVDIEQELFELPQKVRVKYIFRICLTYSCLRSASYTIKKCKLQQSRQIHLGTTRTTYVRGFFENGTWKLNVSPVIKNLKRRAYNSRKKLSKRFEVCAFTFRGIVYVTNRRGLQN